MVRFTILDWAGFPYKRKPSGLQDFRRRSGFLNKKIPAKAGNERLLQYKFELKRFRWTQKNWVKICLH